jgi:hypothetical protein
VVRVFGTVSHSWLAVEVSESSSSVLDSSNVLGSRGSGSLGTKIGPCVALVVPGLPRDHVISPFVATSALALCVGVLAMWRHFSLKRKELDGLFFLGTTSEV